MMKRFIHFLKILLVLVGFEAALLVVVEALLEVVAALLNIVGLLEEEPSLGEELENQEVVKACQVGDLES